MCLKKASYLIYARLYDPVCYTHYSKLDDVASLDFWIWTVKFPNNLKALKNNNNTNIIESESESLGASYQIMTCFPGGKLLKVKQ